MGSPFANQATFASTPSGLHSTRKHAEARLAELGVALTSRMLPQATAPPQLLLAM